MNWLAIIQLIAALMPEVVQLITAVNTAISAAPPQHQAAVSVALTNLAVKQAAISGAVATVANNRPDVPSEVPADDLPPLAPPRPTPTVSATERHPSDIGELR